MGFLDHSTNNIILDAVLTDEGRLRLARNDSSFQITQFALGDDEVDYNVIKHFGRTVGREKIEKNTPVMEAQTAANMGIFSKLITISDAELYRLPTLTILSGGSTATMISLDFITTALLSSIVSVRQNMAGGSSVPWALKDSAMLVEVDTLFFDLSGSDVTQTGPTTYRVSAGSTATTSGGSIADFKIQARAGISTDVFNAYKVAGQDYVSTILRVTGIQSYQSEFVEVRATYGA